MIQIKPVIQHTSSCPYCKNILKPTDKIVWQGIHICTHSKCIRCGVHFIEDLRVGHSVTYPYQVDLEKKTVFGEEVAKEWLGKPLLSSLQCPHDEKIEISKEVFKLCRSVIFLNCIDHLYGHCLLKLLNAQRHLEQHSDYGLVIIVPKFLRWMVPEGVAEVWTVDILLKHSQYYYTKLDEFITKELSRFDKIYVSRAYSHPSNFNIEKFTKVSRHSCNEEKFYITFIWREDRLWFNFILTRIMKIVNIMKIALIFQNLKVRKLFRKIYSAGPQAKFAVVGLGKRTSFPKWIEDFRVDKFEENTEREACQIYSKSLLVIGIHGSNMLLPSGHAGMTIDLMPTRRWPNFGQDILYQESDPRLASFRYRYLPLQTSITDIAKIASDMILGFSRFRSIMTIDKPRSI
jgi:hypothetical protein